MKLGGRQAAVMEVLWEQGEATVSGVQESLGIDPPLAYSTVATVLSRMEKRGLVTHRVEDRQYWYRAAITKDGAGRSGVGELVDRLFSGSPSELVSQLLASDQVDQRQLARIKKLVIEHERRSRKST